MSDLSTLNDLSALLEGIAARYKAQPPQTEDESGDALDIARFVLAAGIPPTHAIAWALIALVEELRKQRWGMR